MPLKIIKPGEHVHSHNLEFKEFNREFSISEKNNIATEESNLCFEGILRVAGAMLGAVIGALIGVGVFSVSKMIADRGGYSNILKDYPNIDGIVPITHSTGCGMNTNSEGMQIFQRTIDGFKNHPNFSHVFVIGLGCESAQVSLFSDSMKKHNRIHFLTIQDEGGTKKIVDKVFGQIQDLLKEANND